jgi:hypothetical protein
MTAPLIITYAVTDDNFNGSPWMPDGSDFWAIVARGRGRTKWRRLTLETSNTDRERTAREAE